MAFFDNLFSSRERGPLFVTTAEIGYYLEKMFKEAEKSIIIISPYIKMSQRIRSILLDKSKNNIDIKIVFKKDFEISNISAQIFKRDNLHAKCFLTEKYALIGSMNLFDYSQVNNDEMGIFLTREENSELYSNIEKEALRLCCTFYSNTEKDTEYTHSKLPVLKIGKEYKNEELNNFFSFMSEYTGGIIKTTSGNIALFYFSKSSKYTNREKDGIIYYMGQNTGSDIQELKYGNKVLHDSFTTGKGRIFLFKDNIFQGECLICKAPFQENGKWIFPLRLKLGM